MAKKKITKTAPKKTSAKKPAAKEVAKKKAAGKIIAKKVAVKKIKVAPKKKVVPKPKPKPRKPVVAKESPSPAPTTPAPTVVEPAATAVQGDDVRQMATQGQLSKLALTLLQLHCSDYGPGIGGGGGSKTVAGHSELDHRKAYRELKDQGLVEPTGSISQASGPRTVYGLTVDGKRRCADIIGTTAG